MILEDLRSILTSDHRFHDFEPILPDFWSSLSFLCQFAEEFTDYSASGSTILSYMYIHVHFLSFCHSKKPEAYRKHLIQSSKRGPFGAHFLARNSARLRAKNRAARRKCCSVDDSAMIPRQVLPDLSAPSPTAPTRSDCAFLD